MDVLTLGCYILETSLMEYSLNINTSQSVLAGAAIVLALKNVKCYKATLKYFNGSKLEEVPNVTSLVKMLKWPAKDYLKSRSFTQIDVCLGLPHTLLCISEAME